MESHNVKKMSTSAEITAIDKQKTNREFYLDELNKFYVNHIPMDSLKDLPDLYKYTFGTAAYFIAIGFFIFFTITSYNNSLVPFLSAQGGPGCTSPSISVTGWIPRDAFYWLRKTSY